MNSIAVSIVFPHQLFKHHPALHSRQSVYIVEEDLFYNQYNFHQQKLLLHRSTMKFYADYLASRNYTVTYVDAIDTLSDIRELLKHLAGTGVMEIHYAEVTDDWLEKRITTTCQYLNIKIKKYRTPSFLNTINDFESFFSGRNKYFQTDFYIWQRKSRKILLESSGKPLGGKWSFDAENRLKFPKNKIAPTIQTPKENEYVKHARQYVAAHFATNYGSTDAPFTATKGYYPSTFEEAEQWLDNFIEHRLADFGIYEDAMVAQENILYHSVLTPILNTGLLLPDQIINGVINAATNNNVPLNSLEGFVRQIVGWREFIRIVYEKEGSRQRTKNYWGFTRKIPASFWTGNTGITPIDIVIKKILKTGYAHHIERLMVLGNFMLLCEFDPNEVYRWFMEMFIDAYDWVMVPNVYGMSQFADGGLMTTKPYISGSNYLMKMGDWTKGEWQQIWDGLFWRFMHVHRDFFLTNPRLGMLVKTFDKMTLEKRNEHLKKSDQFLKQLDSQNNDQKKTME